MLGSGCEPLNTYLTTNRLNGSNVATLLYTAAIPCPEILYILILNRGRLENWHIQQRSCVVTIKKGFVPSSRLLIKAFKLSATLPTSVIERCIDSSMLRKSCTIRARPLEYVNAFHHIISLRIASRANINAFCFCLRVMLDDVRKRKFIHSSNLPPSFRVLLFRISSPTSAVFTISIGIGICVTFCRHVDITCFIA